MVTEHLTGFSDPSNAEFSNNAELLLYQPKYLDELNGRPQFDFFNGILRTLNRVDAVNNTMTSDWKTIFNHAIEDIELAVRERGTCRFSKTQRFTMLTLLKSCFGSFRCFYCLCLSHLCSLICLHQLLPERLSIPISGDDFLVTD